ncbi:trace amine-associated receptor 5-like [Oculina patagonica]
MASNTALIVITCAGIFESLIIIVGNIFTIFVFWKHRNRLKRTSLLLINLAVSDLLVGLTEPISIGTYRLPRQLDERAFNSDDNRHIAITFQSMFSFASVFFLVLISLECACALIWPLRHRVASTKDYIYSVISVWLAATSTGILSLLSVYGVLDNVQLTVAFCALVILCLIMICVSYLTIRTRLNHRVPAIDAAHNRQNGQEQNAKLSKTLFIVIAASLVCWLPSMVLYCVYYLCSECNSLIVLYVFDLFRLANSIVNPFIYSFRISMFRETIKHIKFRRQSKQYRVNYKPNQVIRHFEK